jgi:putative hydrolase of the HAD superfamily
MPSTLRAVLFDMGGTLDGDGLHWLDRFAEAYARAGLPVAFERLRDAFDDAERRASVHETIQSAGLTAMVARHLSWQFEHLGVGDAQLRGRIAALFEAPIREIVQRHAPLLADLRGRGLQLGVVSNGCGNVRALCDDFGYTPHLSTIIDSRIVGVAKPDPRIYAIAVEALAVGPRQTLMVGDSFDRDIVPAKLLGMHTAWLHRGRQCPDARRVDLMLDSLVELPAALDRHGWMAA